MAAAPADYKLKTPFTSKIKSPTLTLEFCKNPDIAKAVGEIKGDRKLVIFSAETDDLIKNAKAKLAAKHADIAVANDVTVKGAGFDVDTNVATILTADGSRKDFGIMPKSELADIILTAVTESYGA